MESPINEGPAIPGFTKGPNDAVILPQSAGILHDRFTYPPFSVLNSREGHWMKRKQAWLRLGIRSELGRGAEPESVSPSLQRGGTGIGYTKSGSKAKTTGNEVSAGVASRYNKKPLTYGIDGWLNGETGEVNNEDGYGTSHFDPVLCELCFNWFCPAGGMIIDPFAGSSVSGMVASYLGRRFWGCDLSPEQVENNQNTARKLPAHAPKPTWVCGDSRKHVPTAPKSDLLFSCPPYSDLEVYSDDPNDISTMNWDDFRDAYADIYWKAVDRLHDNRFAIIVVGDVRDKDGNYRNLPAFTTTVMKKAGLHLYNEMILVTAVGTVALRVTNWFVMSRKIGNTHQRVIVYVKGDAWKATDAVTGMSTQERRDMLEKQAEDRKNAIVGEPE